MRKNKKVKKVAMKVNKKRISPEEFDEMVERAVNKLINMARESYGSLLEMLEWGENFHTIEEIIPKIRRGVEEYILARCEVIAPS